MSFSHIFQVFVESHCSPIQLVKSHLFLYHISDAIFLGGYRMPPKNHFYSGILCTLLEL